MDLREPTSAPPAEAPDRPAPSADRAPTPGREVPSPRAIGSGLPNPERLRHELAQAQKMEAIGQIVPGVAYELRNPLAAIVTFSQQLRHDPRLPDDLRQDAELLVQEADRTRRIIQNLLDFARQRPPERHPTDLRVLVDSVLDLQSHTIGSHGIEVEVDIEPDVPPLPLDRAQMQQVLLNLTLNAVQALSGTGSGGRLRIHATVVHRGDDRFVALSVVDDGPGVPDEFRDRLFVPFFTTRRPGEGAGLGLAVSADIVAAHGGRLRHEPGHGGRGAAFVVELPMTAGVAADGVSTGDRPSNATPTSGPGVAGDGPHRRRRILVLDDEPHIRRILFKALENAGFEPVLATTGQDAIEIVRNGPVEGVLSDHRMAGMTGTDVYEAIVAIRPGLRDRFVFMSGEVLNPALRAFAEAHGVALLAKPFDLASVGRTVHDLLERSATR